MNTEKTSRLLDRVAIVAGAGSREGTSTTDTVAVGNGRAAAILLARAGAYVVIVDQNISWAKRTQDLITSAPADLSHGSERTLVVCADVTIPADCEAVVNATVEKWGRVDILVNNVGIVGPPGTVVDVDPEQWRKAMDINVLGMVLMSKYVIPQMVKTGCNDTVLGTGKAIINLSSVAGLIGVPSVIAYPASKGAVISMTRSMALHHGPAGIRVNAIVPGPVFTPMVASDGMATSLREARINSTALKIEGSGWDIGNAVVFLASDEARWITGVVLPVDAGLTAVQGGSMDF